MTSLRIILEGDGCWPDLTEKRQAGQLIDVTDTSPGIHLAVLPGGMESGKPSVTIRIDLPDGKVVLAQTSLALFLGAARAVSARYGAAE